VFAFWHLFFAVILGVVLFRVARRPNPAWLFVLTTASAGVLPDLDHLAAWSPEFLSKIFPTYLGEGLEFHLRTSAYPLILHFWAWPLLLLASAFILRNAKAHTYLLALGAGWALHLALDGIMTLI
jgi:hypothetical protein